MSFLLSTVNAFRTQHSGCLNSIPETKSRKEMPPQMFLPRKSFDKWWRRRCGILIRSILCNRTACLPSQHRDMKIRGPPSRTSRTRLPSHCGTELLTGSLLICRDGATQWCDGNLTRSSDSKKVKEEDEEWMTVSLRGIRRSGWGWKSFCTEEWFIVKTLQPSHSILSPDKWWLLCAVYSLTAHYRHQYLIVYYTSKISCPPRQATHRSVIAAKLI